MQSAITQRAAPAVVHARDRRPSTFERALFVVLTLVAIGLTHIVGSQESDAGSSPAEAIWGVAYVLAFFGIYRERVIAFPLIRRSLPLLLILGLALLSATWSFDPHLTLRRAFGLVGTTGIAIYVVCRYSLRAFLQTFVVAVDAAAALSFVLVIAVPELGVMQGAGQGAWSGLFMEKNHLGATMELGIVTMLVMLPYSSPKARACLAASIAMCSVLLAGSRSVTSIVGLLLIAGLLAAIFLLRWNDRTLGRGAAIATVCVSVLVALAYAIGFTADDALGFLGRDATLSGRDEVWNTALDYISQQPFLGYGYKVFWEPTGPAAKWLTVDLGWSPSTAHNGFLEACLDFGIVGLLLLVSFLSVGFFRSLQLFRVDRDAVSVWPFLVLLSMTISNFAEATFLLYNEVLWLAVVVAFLYATLDRFCLGSRAISGASGRGLRLRPRPHNDLVLRTPSRRDYL